MAKVFVFTCSKIARMVGYTMDKSGGNLPLKGTCNNWQFGKEIEITEDDPFDLAGDLEYDILNGINKNGYYLNISKEIESH
jgi:hypothetical protein